MKYPMPKASVMAVMLALYGVSGQVAADDTPQVSDKVEVKGILPDNLESVPGSYYVVDEKALEERRPFSVQEALNNVPGINIVGENTFGLGVNIGVRGLNPRRSSRTLVMEDGMPLMLAPYADPSLHFTTPLERVQRIEVVKGSGQILYGPQNIGGMINFVTRPVPTDGFRGSVSVMAGNNDFRGGHVNLGFGGDWGGIMIDALKKQGDGIRKNHDFDIEEFTLKGQFNLTDRQTLIAKVSHFEEKSNVTETGLGLIEYNEDKFQAPTGDNDRFQQKRQSLQLNHIFQIDEKMKLNTHMYYVDHTRASFRQINNPGENAGRSRLERCPGGVDNNNLANADLCGGRWRPREFEFWGIEPRLDFSHNLFGIESDAVVGFRYHREEADRRQYRNNQPSVQSLSAAKQLFGQNGGEGHREWIDIDVEAKSYYAQNTFYVGDWSITPGLRIEDIRIRTNIKRAEGQPQNNPESSLTNRQTEVLPGLGVAWNGIDNTTLFAGVHKGFAPPRPDRDIVAPGGANTASVAKTKPEESINYEVGVRSNYFKGVGLEATLFHIDFDEIVISDGFGSFTNGGESQHSGIELAGRIDFGTVYNTPHNFYVMGSYMNLFTAKFKKTSLANDIVSGDRLPYAPRHVASLSFGYAHPVGLDARIGIDYVSRQREDVSFRDGRSNANVLRGVTGDIPSYALLNASVNYKPVGSPMTYFLSAYNLGDKEFLASRVDGMVAGRERQVFGGVRYDF